MEWLTRGRHITEQRHETDPVASGLNPMASEQDLIAFAMKCITLLRAL